MADTVTAPFTEEQVKSLNQYQDSGVFHPFTCGRCRDTLGIQDSIGRFDDRYRVVTPEGWRCRTCNHTQDWAWCWMADFSWERMWLWPQTESE